mmetsp:Transcript_10614/g.24977  ORF Transcript_10614/g.24977 Transcript_10614/m.24977 type:complete len:121 (-) Transcript_10614:41-403(-)
MPESAAKAINRRKISNTNNGGDDDDSKTTRRCRPGTYNTRWAGFGSTSPNGGTTFMCVAAIACCGMPACANGKKDARGTSHTNRAEWSIGPVERVRGSAPFMVSYLHLCTIGREAGGDAR